MKDQIQVVTTPAKKKKHRERSSLEEVNTAKTSGPINNDIEVFTKSYENEVQG